MSAHTPGSWKPVYMGLGQWSIVGAGSVVAMPSFHAEQESLAHLLAAAPDLLEALQAMVNTWDAYMTSPAGYPAYGKARAAIAKAAVQS